MIKGHVTSNRRSLAISPEREGTQLEIFQFSLAYLGGTTTYPRCDIGQDFEILLLFAKSCQKFKSFQHLLN